MTFLGKILRARPWWDRVFYFDGYGWRPDGQGGWVDTRKRWTITRDAEGQWVLAPRVGPAIGTFSKMSGATAEAARRNRSS